MQRLNLSLCAFQFLRIEIFAEAALQRCHTLAWVFCKLAVYLRNTFYLEQLWKADSVFETQIKTFYRKLIHNFFQTNSAKLDKILITYKENMNY